MKVKQFINFLKNMKDEDMDVFIKFESFPEVTEAIKVDRVSIECHKHNDNQHELYRVVIS